MWESRVVREISKALWKPFCGFHGADISTAVCAIGPNGDDPLERDRVGDPRCDDRRPGRDRATPVDTRVTAVGPLIIGGPLPRAGA